MLPHLMLWRNRLHVRMKVLSTYFIQMYVMFSCNKKRGKDNNKKKKSCSSSLDDIKSGILRFSVFNTDWKGSYPVYLKHRVRFAQLLTRRFGRNFLDSCHRFGNRGGRLEGHLALFGMEESALEQGKRVTVWEKTGCVDDRLPESECNRKWDRMVTEIGMC